MRLLRTELTIAVVGLLVIGALLYFHSLDLDSTFVPAAGGTYTEGIIGTPETLNPLLASHNPADRDLGCLIHAGLLRFDSSGLPVPDLAESWAVTADGLSYTFVLRSGLKWQDGVALSLDDVIFTIDIMQDPGFPGPSDLAALWQLVTLAKISETTLKLTLPEPYAPFLDSMTFSVLPAHVLSGFASNDIWSHLDNLTPIGAGPFALENLRVDTHGNIAEATLVANPYYHGKQPMLSQVKLLFYPDEPSALAALQHGEVMGVGWLSPAAIQELLREPDINVYSQQIPQYRMIILNQRNEALTFFQEKKVRQALLAGLNRRRITDEILQGQAIISNGPIIQGAWAYNSNLSAVEYDPQRAIKLLEAANWLIQDTMLPGSVIPVRQKNGKALNFTLLVPDDRISVQIGNLAVSNWEQLGIQVTLDVLPSATLQSENLFNRRFDAMLVNLSLLGAPDPDPYPFWHQTEIDTGQNYSGYDNRRISELLEQARVTKSLAERSNLYASFQAHFVDQTPALLLYHPVYSYAVHRQLHGVQIGPLLDPSDRFQTIADWYLVTKRVVAPYSQSLGVP